MKFYIWLFLCVLLFIKDLDLGNFYIVCNCCLNEAYLVLKSVFQNLSFTMINQIEPIIVLFLAWEKLCELLDVFIVILKDFIGIYGFSLA